MDGSTPMTAVDRVERFVSERLYAHNRRHVTAVKVYLPGGLPHRTMVLIDTPGMGSVHAHSAQVAQEATRAPLPATRRVGGSAASRTSWTC